MKKITMIMLMGILLSLIFAPNVFAAYEVQISLYPESSYLNYEDSILEFSGTLIPATWVVTQARVLDGAAPVTNWTHISFINNVIQYAYNVTSERGEAILHPGPGSFSLNMISLGDQTIDPGTGWAPLYVKNTVQLFYFVGKDLGTWRGDTAMITDLTAPGDNTATISFSLPGTQQASTSVQFADLKIDVGANPEPTTIISFALGLLGFALKRFVR